ncbi:MAG TPA: SdrD B-like domain-containing protein [Pirellulales bacterium]|nr:SdrD B-like domain-containing protein [Pirellulales bacterium]
MGLLSKVCQWRRRLLGLAPQHESDTNAWRICRFEQVEERFLMAADVHLGVVYDDAASGGDVVPNTFTVTWSGGAPGAELKQLTINTDPTGQGLQLGEVFFNTAAGGLGAYAYSPLNIVSHDGFQVSGQNPANGSQLLTLNFSGFTAGKELVFTIDVDQKTFLGSDAIAEGAEFEGSILTGSFSAPHYADLTSSDIFYDSFNSKLQASGLNLPADDYIGGLIGGTTVNNTPVPVLTAGAFLHAKQTPLPITLEGTVYYDPDSNNVQEPGEPGIANVTLSLYSFDGTNYTPTGMTATTDANGHYKFTDVLPGNYRIVKTEPAGYFNVGASAGNAGGVTDGVVTDADTLSQINVLGGEDVVHNDFSESLPNSISGKVIVDNNGNCAANPANPPLAGVTIRLLDKNGNVVQTTTTDANGLYKFQGLMPGAYTVHKLTPAGYFDEDSDVGSLGGTSLDASTLGSIVLTSALNGVNYDFCELLPVEISGRVIVDKYGDCETNPNNPPLAGVTIQLLDASGTVLATTTTNANGQYEFQGYRPGTYTVHELTPSGDFAEASHVGSAGGTSVDVNTLGSIALTSGQNGQNYDFCVVQPIDISGEVVVDAYGGCDTNPANPSLAGVTIQLFDSSGTLLATTTTDANGQYRFQGYRPGTYTVHELTPNGDFAGASHVGSAGGTSVDVNTLGSIALTSGQSGQRYDFCVVQPVGISGEVVVDQYGGCDTNPANPPLAGVTIQLLDQSGRLLQTTVTDANGAYQFQGLMPGTYTVQKLTPNGYFDEDAQAGSAGGVVLNVNTIGTISLSSGDKGANYDFCEVQPASISGYVKVEDGKDCQTDPTTPPLAGVTIQLLDSQGNVIDATLTDANGHYAFGGLHPGTYGVHELLPAGYFDADQHVGSAGGAITGQDLITGAALGSGTSGVHYDFCVNSPSAIAGYVFQDGGPIGTPDPATDLPSILQNLPSLRNGVLTPGDTRLAGVVLELADAAGQLLLDAQGNPITAVTDANGYYQFVNLPPGIYTVLKVHPNGYIDGINTAGTLGGVAINPTLLSFGVTSQGVSASDALLQAVGINDAIAMITISGGQFSQDNNFSEITLVQQTVTPVLPPDSNLPPPTPLFTAPPISPGAALAGPGSLPAVVAPYLYGSWGVMGTTWHLSVIDAGLPRGARPATGLPLHLTGNRFRSTAWQTSRMKAGLWILHPGDAPGGRRQTIAFGKADGIPVTGDFNGDGVCETGIYKNGEWFIDLNGNGEWDKDDLWARLGSADDRPVTGDWDGDGKTDIGIFGPAWPGDPRAVAVEPGLPDPYNAPTGARKNMPPEEHQATLGCRTMKRTQEGEVRADLIDHVFHFGTPDDIPITGDWTGAGIDSIGIFHKGRWILDVDGDGKRSEKDLSIYLGESGDRPVVGDFDGDGIDELGVYRDGKWIIDINHDAVLDERDLYYELGGAEHRPVVGDWDGDGCDQIGIHEEQAAPSGSL